MKGDQDGLVLISTNGPNSYYYSQVNSTFQLGGNNAISQTTYTNPSLSQNVQIRFTGQYDIKVTVGKSSGSISDYENNTYYVYNINSSLSLFESIQLQYVDILGQTYNQASQLNYINTTETVLYLVAPHKNIAYTIN